LEVELKKNYLMVTARFMKGYKYKLRFFAICFFSVYLISCEDNPTNTSFYPPDNNDQVTINEGVWGNVWFWEGNFMPSTDGPSGGKITPVKRVIYAYKATQYDEVEPGNGIFFNKINTELVAVTVSRTNGFYQILLPPGKYSFFVKENDMYYANGADNEHIQPAIVVENEVTKRQIDINYKAVY